MANALRSGRTFDDRTLVFSVKGKMFCATDIETFEFLNLKCDPEEAVLLREKYSEVIYEQKTLEQRKNHRKNHR